jgi:hypothetical protein
MDRRELESASATYAHLRGLLMLPLGALLIVSALANAEVLPVWSLPVALLPAGAVSALVLGRYRRTYGSVSRSPRGQRRDAAAMAVSILAVIGSAVALGGLDVNVVAVGFGLGMLLSYAISPGLRAHHVAIWGGLLVAGAVPLWDGADPENTGLVLAGAAVAICGILDHRVFTDAFSASDARA